MPTPQIDPQTGERVQASGSPQIDPTTGERVAATPAAQPAAQDGGIMGGLKSFADATGLRPLAHSIMHPIQAQQEESQAWNDHPMQKLGESIVPGLGMIEGAYQGAKRIGGELADAGKSAMEGNGAGAAYHGIKAVPFVGPALDRASDESEPIDSHRDSYGTQLGATLSSPRAMGTLAGTAATVAPMIVGGIDAATPEPLNIGRFPSRARASATFESLNKDLANQPVNLTKTIQPLQRIAEIGERGSTLPTAASKLLTRSQAVSPMTFPEARDYQGSLSDLSASDKLALNGRMKGGISQVNKALFEDLQDTANSAGRGEDYADAMKEYRQASQLRDLARKGGKAAIGAAGLGLAGHYLGSLVPSPSR